MRRVIVMGCLLFMWATAHAVLADISEFSLDGKGQFDRWTFLTPDKYMSLEYYTDVADVPDVKIGLMLGGTRNIASFTPVAGEWTTVEFKFPKDLLKRAAEHQYPWPMTYDVGVEWNPRDLPQEQDYLYVRNMQCTSKSIKAREDRGRAAT